MTYRFLHSSDLHLGRAYGGFPEDIRGRLREARHTVIARLASAAREAGAIDVLLAGDTFDAETPSPETLRHALRAMAAEGDLRWMLMPGNHDSLAASELWRRVQADAPENLVVLSDPVPVELASDVWLLPAPCTQRRPGRDLTEAMSAPTPEGAIRIGLGHGAIMDFTSDEGSPGIIPPDRARLSGLDYLGLGDWHGRMQIGPATWYSGTPESGGFKHDTAPGALVVHIAASGAPAQASVAQTGQFDWLRPVMDMLPGEDISARLAHILPPETRRRDTLLRLEAAGRLTLAERAAFETQLAAIAPDFGWFETDLARVATEVKPYDLDLIDRGGALRRAADALLSESADPSRAQAHRDLADLALSRLYALVQEVDA
ncbi:metallophosphoesterase family protein [Paracoccus onubensis]|uniref:DNA repair exonuclease n=1 Tax=Paracoccus onubensis TaxID=1675788 RepID=A0A418SX23_9RHOB|nr:DNA repair exonuclease [Paracoccus onubensis]RJE85509.1 DNA repair exonuclease [Paracoccus onubensis]